MNQFTLSRFTQLSLIAVILSCNSSDTTESETNIKDTTKTASGQPNESSGIRPAHWSYSEEDGPDGWARLSTAYALCGSGKSQSPINLITNTGKGANEWKVEYKTTGLRISHNQHMEEIIDNGHTIQVTPDEGSTITYEGKVFHLKQFHFHTPSEHTVNGNHAPMEIHLVHQADDKSLAVIGVMVQNGKHNSNFDQLIKHLPNSPGEKITKDSVKVEIGIHVPKELSAYHYMGSLTTPPCSENVQWLVLKNPINMSQEQIMAFSSRLKHNNRPTQALNERAITIDDIPTKNN